METQSHKQVTYHAVGIAKSEMGTEGSGRPEEEHVVGHGALKEAS